VNAAFVTMLPPDCIWRPYAVTAVLPVPKLSMNRPPSPTVMPPMSVAVPLFWTKKVLPGKIVIVPAPTKPLGLDVPLLVPSAVSRPVKLGLASSWVRMEPWAIHTFGALNSMRPASAPALSVMTMLPMSVFTSIFLPALRVRESLVPALIQWTLPLT
jgi:hypothetical protein